ncbi:hypothetical protein ACIG63_33435 [Streptomyces antimycoticus]|uniref:hypothetical protein n=1 Tax=Streptomyces antimycoticus TaxID=68175 RepID=UPI0037CD6BAF
MDATMAGLVGALGGAMLGAGGAWGAAMIAFRAARYQADRQADSQHQQWLRQIRRETYSSFLAAAYATQRHLLTAMNARVLGMDEEGQAERRQLREAAVVDQTRFEDIRSVLVLEAPEEVREKAAELSRIFTALFKGQTWRHGDPGLQRGDMKRYEQARKLINEIQELCRTSLTEPQ